MCKNLRFTKISILFIVILIVVRMFAQHYRLSGDCMEPAFKDGSSYFVNLVLPYFRAYQAGDVVVFEHEGKKSHQKQGCNPSKTGLGKFGKK